MSSISPCLSTSSSVNNDTLDNRQELNVSITKNESDKQTSPNTNKKNAALKKSSGFSIDDLISSSNTASHPQTGDKNHLLAMSTSSISPSNSDKSTKPNLLSVSPPPSSTSPLLSPSSKSQKAFVSSSFMQNQHLQMFSSNNLNSPTFSLNGADSADTKPSSNGIPSHQMMWSSSAASSPINTLAHNLIQQPSYASMQSSSSPSSSVTSTSSSSSSNMLTQSSPMSPSNTLNMQQQQQHHHQQYPQLSDPQMSALHFHLQREQTLNMLRNGARFFDPRFGLPRMF